MKNHKKTPAHDLETLMPILLGVWRRMHKLSGPPDKLQTREFRSVVDGVKTLHSRSQKGESIVGKDYFQDRDLLGAYLLYDWVVHYQQGLSLIGELPSTPRRVLDLCSGAAPFAFAALRHGAQDAVAIDQNALALQLGGEVCGRYGLPLTVRQWNCLKHPLPVDGFFDLIIAAHCLEDLFPQGIKGWSDHQNTFIKGLLKKLTPEGCLLIVDSSYNEANRRVLQLRDACVAEGVPVQAPCVWRGECPALKTPNNPCYAQREFEKPFLVKEIQRAASINLSSLKMSYVIFRNPAAGWPPLVSEPLYRVISPPIDSFSGKRFYLCGTDGKKHLESRMKEHPVDSRAFDYLKRGELIAVENALEQQNALDIVEGTTVKVVAACGKPVPWPANDLKEEGGV